MVAKLRFNPFASPLTAPGAFIAVLVARVILPWHATRAIRGGGAVDAMMAPHHLVTPRLVRASAAPAARYVWTLDELPRIRRLVEMGVHGVISNDRRLFAALA